MPTVQPLKAWRTTLKAGAARRVTICILRPAILRIFHTIHQTCSKTTTRLTEERMITMYTFRAVSVLFCVLLWLFGPLARGGKQLKYEVNLAAAYASDMRDGWARHVFWQDPTSGKIVGRRRDPGTQPSEIRTAISPRKNSPLSAYFYRNPEITGREEVSNNSKLERRYH